MLLHGFVCFPLCNDAKYVFLVEIPVHTVIKTSVFFTKFKQKRAQTIDELIDLIFLNDYLYLILNPLRAAVPMTSGSASSPQGLQAGFRLAELTARREGSAYSSERPKA